MSTYGQHNLSVETFNVLPDYMIHLNESKYFKENNLANHLIVDEVEAMTIDSVFTRKFERHRVIGGGFIRLLGYRWKSYNQQRDKFVGWVAKNVMYNIDSKDRFTEYDVNYDLIPALPHYKQLSYEMYQAQMGMKKSKKQQYAGQEPFIYPNDSSNMLLYNLHCENTPAEAFRSQLNTWFYPVHRNNDLNNHPNFEALKPIIGMYGVLALDCNHKCHPEMHPYEWLWWLNLTEEKTSWNIGLLRDVSNRFKHWSASPRVGMIKIPFCFSLKDNFWEINIEHQMFSNFNEQAFQQLNLSNEFHTFEKLTTSFKFNLKALENTALLVKSNIRIPYQSLQFAIKEINVDSKNQLLSGFLYIASSVEDVYTAEVKFNSSKLQID